MRRRWKGARGTRQAPLVANRELSAARRPPRFLLGALDSQWTMASTASTRGVTRGPAADVASLATVLLLKPLF